MAGAEKYLIRARGKKNSAHLWDGNNTACRMWLTGGMDHRRRYRMADSPDGHPICHMCLQNSGTLRKEASNAASNDPAVMRICLKMFADMIEIVRSADPKDSDAALSRLTDVLDDWEHYFDEQMKRDAA